MFTTHGVDGRYYLNKILKRKNNNLHCAVDKTIIKEDNGGMVDVRVVVDGEKVKNDEGYHLEVRRETPHVKITVKTYSGYVYALETLSQMIQDNRIQVGIIED